MEYIRATLATQQQEKEEKAAESTAERQRSERFLSQAAAQKPLGLWTIAFFRSWSPRGSSCKGLELLAVSWSGGDDCHGFMIALDSVNFSESFLPFSAALLRW